MKLQGEWIVACDRAIKDATTNQMTIVSTVDRISSLTFPAMHPRFAVAARVRRIGPANKTAVRVEFRIVRISDRDGEEVVGQLDGSWASGSRYSTVGLNFAALRLLRPETISFRLDHRIEGEDWIAGPSTSIDIVPMELSEQQRQSLTKTYQAAGVPLPTGLDAAADDSDE